MRGAITDVIAARAKDDGGLGRRFAYSLAAHVVLGLAFILISSNFLAGKQSKPNVIEINLAGSLGPKTTGVAPIAGRRVDQPEPETKRPAPVLPAPPPRPDTMPTPAKAVPPKAPEKAPEKAAPAPTTPPKPPATGERVQPGTAAVETGNTGTSQGLTQGGGGGTGGVVDLNTFDPIWVQAMRDGIQKQWNNLQSETGWTEVLFTVTRDGTVIFKAIAASSGSFFLNQEAERAVGKALIPPLPRDFKEPTLRVRLRFNYGVK